LKRENAKEGGQVKVTFVIPNDPSQPRISVVGDFNGWDPEATPLVKRANNTRSASVTLDPNRRYAFRYFVADGGWFNDEAADDYVSNEFDSQNCIIVT
jgi:hypothetical protein